MVRPLSHSRPPGPRSRAACALGMSRHEMLGKRQVAAPLVAQRAAHGALRPADRRLQPGAGVGVQLGGLRPGGKPQRPSQCQFGHETPGLGFTLVTPAASRPSQHRAVRRRRGRQVAPCGHAIHGRADISPVGTTSGPGTAAQNIQSGAGWVHPGGQGVRHGNHRPPYRAKRGGEPVAQQPQQAEHSAGVTALAGRDGQLRSLHWFGLASGVPGRGRSLGACPSRSG